MRYLIAGFLFLTTFAPTIVGATAQMPDEILLDGETSRLHSEPLNHLLGRRPEDGGIKLDRPFGMCTASFRGYKATWHILDDQLFLDRVVVDPCAKEPKEVSIESLFSGAKAPIFASWHTGILVIPRGKLVDRVHLGYLSTYERYVVLIVKKGRVVSRVDLDEPPR
jgi:hypothetical protein